MNVLQNLSYLWKVQSWVYLGWGWSSCHPQWPWWDWACCWPSLRASLPIAACGSWLWLDTSCHSRWRGGCRSRSFPSHWLQTHSGFCHWVQFCRGLHSHSSAPRKTCYPSWSWWGWLTEAERHVRAGITFIQIVNVHVIFHVRLLSHFYSTASIW